MIAALRAAWDVRTARDRVTILILAAVGTAILCTWLLSAAAAGRSRLYSSLPGLRAQAARMDSHAGEYARLRAAQSPPPSRIDLRTLLEASARETSIAPAVVAMDAVDANQVKVVFGAVPFADWLSWVTALQSQQVRVEQSRIEALSTAGLVSVTVTFARTPP